MPPSHPPASGAAAPEDELDRISQVAQGRRRELTALARHEGLTPEEAVDCVQDAVCTLLDLVQSGQVDSSADFAPVLATVVRNAARNQRRRHFRSKPHASLEAQLLVDDELPLQEDVLARAEDIVRLRACVAELCEIQRAVVTLRLLDEQPGEDVAGLLGVSPNHVAVLLHRAKSALRACMTVPDNA